MDLLRPPPEALHRAHTNPEQQLPTIDTTTTTTAPVPRRQSFHRSRSVPGNELRQVITAQFIDDYGAHHYNPDHHSDDDDDHTGGLISPSSSTDEKVGSSEWFGRQPTTSTTHTHSNSSSSSTDPANLIDLERGRTAPAGDKATLTREKTSRSTRSTKDPFLVRFSTDDPANPKTWSFKRRWAATAIVSVFTFISPTSSSMSAPAITQIGHDLHVTQETELSLLISIFVLAYAIGPLFLGPLSEIYGRRIVLQLSNLFFLAFNLGCGFAQTSGQLIAFRFLSGLGGSAPLAIGGGVLSDCWDAEHRGQAVGIYSLMPLLGPALGPVAGGWIAEKTTWRWCFWSTSILTVLIQVLGVLFLRETFGPVILARKAKALRKETGDQRWHTEWESPDRTLGKVMRVSLGRPFRLLASQPIIQVLALYMAFIYGLMYLVLTTFPMVWENVYHESVGIGGLNYLSLGLGFFVGAQTVARANDYIYRKLKARNNGVGRPEFRAPMILPGAILVPSGIFLYGWSAEYHVHWIVPNIGAAMFAAGTIATFQCTQTYIVDTYSTYAASAVAAVTVLRSLAGFGFPLFARQMFQALGYGWGCSLLGFVAIGFGLPAPFVLWKYGEKLRARSQFAREG